MSSARKKFHPKSTQSSKAPSTNSEESSGKFIEKLDTIRSSFKDEKKKITVKNTAKNINLAAATLIIVVVMSGIILLSPKNGIIPSPVPPTTSPPVPLKDGYFNDTSAVLSISNNKINIVSVSGEFCPYCAVDRWVLVMALSKYGTFSNLQTIYSDESNIPTYTFHGASYTSSKINFQPCEVLGNTYNPNTQSYNKLDEMNPLQSSLMNKYNSGGSIPFFCIGGQIYRVGAGTSININSFTGQTVSQVQSQINTQSGTLYSQIKTESDYLVSLIDATLTSSNMTSSSINS